MTRKMPILPNPDFLSTPLQHYIAEIAAQADRIIVFADHAVLRSQPGTLPSLAALLSPPEWAGAAIFVDKSKIKRATYDPAQHDPIIAHEVTHLQLLVEGWCRLRPAENTDNQTREKIRTVENWLTDPVINSRIATHGFSLKAVLESQAAAYLEELKGAIASYQYMRSAGGVPTVNVQTGERSLTPVAELIEADRLYHTRRLISLLLAGDISAETKQQIKELFAQAFPEFIELSNQLLEPIQAHGFDTPEKYQQTVPLCLQAWDVNATAFGFQPHQRFLPNDKQAWLKTMTVRRGNWR